MLSESQLNRLSEFASNLALVFLASVVAPFFTGTDIIDITRILVGLLLMLIALAGSLLLIREKRK